MLNLEKTPSMQELEALRVGTVASFSAVGNAVKLEKTEAGFKLEANEVHLELRRHLLALAESLPTLNFLARGYTISGVYLCGKELTESVA